VSTSEQAYALPELDGWLVDRSAAPSADAAMAAGLAAASANAVAAAERRGYDEGLAAGRTLAQADLEPVRAALAAASTGLGAARDEVVAAVEIRAVELAIALAEKILCTALELDPARLLDVIAGALRRLVDKDEVVLVVNPAHVGLLQAEIQSLGASAGCPRVIEIVGERRVGPGGCIVRTRDGEIDARIESQLARAEELLRRSLASSL